MHKNVIYFTCRVCPNNMNVIYDQEQPMKLKKKVKNKFLDFYERSIKITKKKKKIVCGMAFILGT